MPSHGIRWLCTALFLLGQTVAQTVRMPLVRQPISRDLVTLVADENVAIVVWSSSVQAYRTGLNGINVIYGKLPLNSSEGVGAFRDGILYSVGSDGVLNVMDWQGLAEPRLIGSFVLSGVIGRNPRSMALLGASHIGVAVERKVLVLNRGNGNVVREVVFPGEVARILENSLAVVYGKGVYQFSVEDGKLPVREVQAPGTVGGVLEGNALYLLMCEVSGCWCVLYEGTVEMKRVQVGVAKTVIQSGDGYVVVGGGGEMVVVRVGGPAVLEVQWSTHYNGTLKGLVMGYLQFLVGTDLYLDVHQLPPSPYSTPSPTTSSPPIRQPVVGYAVKRAYETTTAVGAALGVALAMSGGSPGAGGRMARSAMYLSMLECPRSGVEEVDIILNPTQLELGSGTLRQLRGSLVGNTSLLFVLLGLMWAVRCAGVSEAPSSVFFIAMDLLWGGMGLSAFGLLLYGGPGDRAVGAGVVVVLVAGVWLVWDHVEGEVVHIDEPQTCLAKFYHGGRTWKGASGFFAPVYTGLKVGYTMYYSYQLILITVVALMGAWNPSTIIPCSGRAGVVAVLPVVWAVMVGKDRPFLRPVDTVCEVVLALLEFVATALAFLGVVWESRALVEAAGITALVVGYLATARLLLAGLVDAVAYVRSAVAHGSYCGDPKRRCSPEGCPTCCEVEGVSFFRPPAPDVEMRTDIVGGQGSQKCPLDLSTLSDPLLHSSDCSMVVVG